MNHELYELPLREPSPQPVGAAAGDEEHFLRSGSSDEFVEVAQASGPIPTTEVSAQGSNASKGKLNVAWRSWGWEISNSILVFISPVVILATLYPHSGHPLPQWSSSISINSLLSIYTLVMKASLSFIATSCIGQHQWSWFSIERPLFDLVRYDNAGRGAWGSVQLLFAHRLRQPLAALGASLLVMTIGIDPSVQQLVGLFDCSVVVGEQNAALPRTNWFQDITETSNFGRDLNSALVRGSLPSSAQSDDLVIGCVTGNCTFSEPYTTVGYCSSCTDSSDEITTSTVCSTDVSSNISVNMPSECSFDNSATFTINSSLSRKVYESIDAFAASRLNTSYSLQGSKFGEDGYIEWKYVTEGVEVAAMSHYYDLDNLGEVQRTPEHPERIQVKVLAGKTSFSDRHLAISTGQTIAGCEDKQLMGSWQCRGYGSATCSIQPCVRVYNATIKAGHFTEHLIENSGTESWGGYDKTSGGLGLVDIRCLSPLDKSKLEESGYTIGQNDRWLPYNATLDSSAITNSLLAQKCLYYMSRGFASSVGPFLIGAYFNGKLKGVGGRLVFEPKAITDFDGPQALQTMYNSGNISLAHIESVFASISESLTTFIRSNGAENYSDPAVGQVYHYATCLKVHWEWITYSSLSALLTVLFLVLTIYSQSNEPFPVWKTSFLPWMTYCSEGSGVLQNHASTLSSQESSELVDMSKTIKVTWKKMADSLVSWGVVA